MTDKPSRLQLPIAAIEGCVAGIGAGAVADLRAMAEDAIWRRFCRAFQCCWIDGGSALRRLIVVAGPGARSDLTAVKADGVAGSAPVNQQLSGSAS